MKAASEIFKLAAKLNIKPKDIIGMGGDIVKMGQSLFTEKVNPKLLKFVQKKGDVPPKILEEIKIHLRSLKNASDNQIELFKLNLKEIVSAKSPVTGIKRPGTLADDMAAVETQMGNIKKTSSKLDDAIKEYENIYKPTVKDEAAEAFKGWTPTVIKGGKEPKFNSGGVAKLNAELNQLPEYYLPMADGGRIPYGSGSNGSNGTSSNTMAELHSLLDKSLSGSLSSDEQSRLEYLIDITGYLNFKTGGIANHFRKK